MAALQQRIDAAVDHVAREISGLRGGRAVPALVEDVAVDAYGTTMPLKQLATVSVSEARTLTIAPWDKQNVGPIVKALQEARLGASPTVQGEIIHFTIPALTQERRAELLKLLGKMIEEGRIALRRIREDELEDLKRRKDRKELSEDTFFREKDHLEELVKEGNEKLDALRERKEAELETV